MYFTGKAIEYAWLGNATVIDCRPTHSTMPADDSHNMPSFITISATWWKFHKICVIAFLSINFDCYAQYANTNTNKDLGQS